MFSGLDGSYGLQIVATLHSLTQLTRIIILFTYVELMTQVGGVVIFHPNWNVALKGGYLTK